MGAVVTRGRLVRQDFAFPVDSADIENLLCLDVVFQGPLRTA